MRVVNAETLEPVRTGPPRWQYAVAALACAALLVLGFVYLSSGLVAPLWAVVVLMVFWVGLALLAARWLRVHPLRVVWLPLVGLAVIVGVITAGEHWLGWIA
jgi:hypothetical protein